MRARPVLWGEGLGNDPSYPADNELAVRIAAFQGRMNPKQAEYRTDISRLAEDMAKRDADNHTDASRRFIALVGMIANGVTILVFPIHRPA